MTDITTGNFGINAPSVVQGTAGQAPQPSVEPIEEQTKADETNLNNNPAASFGRAMVKPHLQEYKRNPADTEEDVKKFMSGDAEANRYAAKEENTLVAAEMARDMYNEMIANGENPDVAFEKAFTAAACLISNANV